MSSPLLLRRARRSEATASGAEQTGVALRPVRRRGQVLGWVPRMPTGSGALFDMVLTAAGPLALDSVHCDGGTLDARFVEDAATRARDAAREAQSVLGVAGYFDSVLPVVVVWGGDSYAVPSGGCLKHGVLFLRGRELRHWLRCELSRGARVDGPEAEDLLVRLAMLPV